MRIYSVRAAVCLPVQPCLNTAVQQTPRLLPNMLQGGLYSPWRPPGDLIARCHGRESAPAYTDMTGGPCTGRHRGHSAA